MHIFFVFEDFCLGGVERVTEQLITGLQSIHNCNITIVCEQKSGDLTARFKELAPIYELGNKNKFINFRQISLDLNPDLVVFTKGGLSKYGLFISKKIKKIAIQHTPINLPQESRFKNVVRRLGATFLYSQLDAVVCVSKGILTNLVKLNVVSKNNVHCIYNPVLDESIKQLANKEVKYSDYFVCVGRLHHQKGYDLLVDAIGKAKQTNHVIKVVIIGDGPELKNLKKLISDKSLSDNIILHGSTNNPYKYIANAKAILLTSRWEGLPTVLVEAAYLNTPIITFDCRYGPKELTNNGKNGYLVDFLDTDQLVKKIITVNEKRNLLPSPAVDDFLLPAATQYYYTLFKSLL
ncbi:hypothetical protein PAT01_31180 [Pseudoalteromonas atlantica]|uniref:Glycosyl transferase n=1 Tax=Pseudoalteromonas atlantica TaxID=288 RepID=A0ABQ0UH76_PSEAF|nr:MULTISPECIES: glycosyltransferase [Pseudoalteromonas]MCK8095595.1 glycosyltransferase [Pseudoalteromonas sp. 1CM17D]GEK77814.1 hypothetical protein PAT01_31180 [Pseudoalteromonas atlantica]